MRFPLAVILFAGFLTCALAGTAIAQHGKGDEMATQNLKTAIFGGGCFWCMESSFDRLEGVTDVMSGYAGGHVVNPTYEQVSSGTTGHIEVIQVTYNPAKIEFGKLLEIFWENVDPFDAEGQFCDKGEQYVAVIFTADDREKALAEASKLAKEKHFGKPVATKILPKAVFYPAEDYHQEYYKKNPLRYKMYRNGCGRDERLKELRGE